MKIKKKTGGFAGMSGWLVEDANISIAVDELTQSQSVVCYPNHKVESYQEAKDLVIYLDEDELKLLKKIFRIEE